jgi:hypothetical protein
MMYFYSWAEPAHLRNREVRTPEKRGMTVRWLVPYGVKLHCRSGMEKAMLVDYFRCFYYFGVDIRFLRTVFTQSPD